jgi:hypothetical protein
MNFIGMCETSVASSTSLKSTTSGVQNPFRDPLNMSSGYLEPPFAERVEVTRHMFISSMVPVLTRLSENLAEAKQVVEELREVASLLLEYKGH